MIRILCLYKALFTLHLPGSVRAILTQFVVICFLLHPLYEIVKLSLCYSTQQTLTGDAQTEAKMTLFWSPPGSGGLWICILYLPGAFPMHTTNGIAKHSLKVA